MTGPMGPAGATGNTGAPGANGNDGAVGPIGPQGLQGPMGLSITGPEGPQGLTGAAGAAGAAGPQGIQGIQGQPGIAGMPGAASTVPGPVGPSGPTGPAGQNAVVSTWASGGNYSTGQFVFLPQDATNPGGIYGLAINLTGQNNGSPFADYTGAQSLLKLPADWFVLTASSLPQPNKAALASLSAAIDPPLPLSLSGSTGLVLIGNCPLSFDPTQINTYCNRYQITGLANSNTVSYTNFSFTVPTMIGQTFYVAIGNTRSGGAIWCYVRSNQDVSCTNATQGGGSLTINPGDQDSIFIGLESQANGTGGSYSWPSSNWSLNP